MHQSRVSQHAAPVTAATPAAVIDVAEAALGDPASPVDPGTRTASPEINAVPPDDPDEPPQHHQSRARRTVYHPYITGRPCDSEGNYIDFDAPPPGQIEREQDDYTPFDARAQFEIADFLFREEQMSAAKVDKLMHLWAATLPEGQDPPFANHRDLHERIDAIEHAGVRWQTFSVTYKGPRPDGEVPSWMEAEYDVWYRCPRAVVRSQLSNADFNGEMDFSPKRSFDSADRREYKDFMSGNWAWEQADIIAQDPENHDATFCPIILGSDKTTVSVATGQNEYYPLYLSNGLVYNSTRRAQRNAVSVVAFLAIPKTDAEHKDSPKFRKFRRQLFHSSLNTILQPLRPGMTTPEVTRLADGHFRRVIYGLGPYIADYPEQVLLACVVQGWCARCTATPSIFDSDPSAINRSHAHTYALLEGMDLKRMWEDYGIVGDLVPFTVGFPRADIHELLSPDLLHQVIKGTFKDHLVAWVEEYLESVHGKAGAAAIVADIDRRIAAVPNFSGLRRFPEGRGFKQWTGDDSKALMKVYLPAISGHVPPQVVRSVSAFLEFCHLVRRSVITQDTLAQIGDALDRFHRERVIFEELGIRFDGFSLPRQHSLLHYRRLIQLFGAPNGLCSSITESKHIKAVKEPWRRSNRYKALGQMLLTNQRVDKLIAQRVEFDDLHMLDGECTRLTALLRSISSTPRGDAAAPNGSLPPPQPIRDPTEEDTDCPAGPVDGPRVDNEVVLARSPARKYPRELNDLAHAIDVPHFPELVRRFLFDQLNRNPEITSDNVDLAACPIITSKVFVYPSAIATFYAPSDESGTGGMRREYIRSTASWRDEGPRRDCAFIEKSPDVPGFAGLHAVRVQLFFSFIFEAVRYPCALVSWFSPISDSPDEDTGMWIVSADLDQHGRRPMSVIHLDTMLRAAHLIGVAGSHKIPLRFKHTDSLDSFNLFYVNKYADHHAHEIAF